VATTCAHGFDPAECLICRTLGSSTATAERPRDHRHRSGPATAVTPSQVQTAPPTAPKPRPGRRMGTHLAMVVVASAVIVLAVILASGVLFTALRLFELVVVALGAGWVGYRLGYLRGSRQHPPR